MKRTYVRPSISVREMEVEQHFLAASRDNPTGGLATDKDMGFSGEDADGFWSADSKRHNFVNWEDNDEQ